MEDIQLFCTAGRENLSVQSLQGGLRMAQLTARALRSTPSRKIWALASPPSPDTSSFTCVSLRRRKERYHNHPAVMVPTNLGVGLAPLQHGRGFLRLCICHFLTRAAVGILRSQVPVQGLASVTSWAFNVCPTRTGALQRGRRRKEQVRTCSTVAECGVCYSGVGSGCFEHCA